MWPYWGHFQLQIGSWIVSSGQQLWLKRISISSRQSWDATVKRGQNVKIPILVKEPYIDTPQHILVSNLFMTHAFVISILNFKPLAYIWALYCGHFQRHRQFWLLHWMGKMSDPSPLANHEDYFIIISSFRVGLETQMLWRSSMWMILILFSSLSLFLFEHLHRPLRFVQFIIEP